MAAAAAGMDMASSDRPAVIIDNGTGYTKMGYAGNVAPNFIVPTTIATKDNIAAGTTFAAGKDSMTDLDFYIGDEAFENQTTHLVDYPVREGTIENWNHMERMWQRCIYQYLRCDPEEHYFVLTEPPLNPPENREYTAEVMFETFNVPGLYIGVQAVLALAASWTSRKEQHRSLTGTVIDSGDGVTHVIPVAEGYVIGSCIRHIPLAGSNITQFVLDMLRGRGEGIPPDVLKEAAKQIKEEHCYVCRDLASEFHRFDRNPHKHFKQYAGRHFKTKSDYSATVGYEQFLGPELFFNPEVFSGEYSAPLSEVVDECIVNSPIDTRRELYGNIVLSGGSTMFKNFGKRLQQDIKARVEARIDANMRALKPGAKRPEMKVKVISHAMQRYAVWFGGSLLACAPQFHTMCHTKAQYEEEGPRIARHNAVFQATM